MEALSGPGASPLEKIAAVGIPVAAGVASAASPAGARGLAGLNLMLRSQLAARQIATEREKERRLGEALTGVLGQEVTPGQPARFERPDSLNLQENPEAAGIPGQMTPATATTRFRDILGPLGTALEAGAQADPRLTYLGTLKALGPEGELDRLKLQQAREGLAAQRRFGDIVARGPQAGEPVPLPEGIQGPPSPGLPDLERHRADLLKEAAVFAPGAALAGALQPEGTFQYQRLPGGRIAVLQNGRLVRTIESGGSDLESFILSQFRGGGEPGGAQVPAEAAPPGVTQTPPVESQPVERGAITERGPYAVDMAVTGRGAPAGVTPATTPGPTTTRGQVPPWEIRGATMTPEGVSVQMGPGEYVINFRETAGPRGEPVQMREIADKRTGRVISRETLPAAEGEAVRQAQMIVNGWGYNPTVGPGAQAVAELMETAKYPDDVRYYAQQQIKAKYMGMGSQPPGGAAPAPPAGAAPAPAVTLPAAAGPPTVPAQVIGGAGGSPRPGMDPMGQARAAKIQQAEREAFASTAARERAQNIYGAPEASQQEALRGLQSVTAAIRATRKKYSRDEIENYIRASQKPGINLAQIVSGVITGDSANALKLYGVTNPTRFQEFLADVGRLQATAFDVAGKNLTVNEKNVMDMFTPTGQEPGGAEQFIAKLVNLDRFVSLNTRLRSEIMRSGKGALTPEEFQRRLEHGMRQSGFDISGGGEQRGDLLIDRDVHGKRFQIGPPVR